MDDQRLTIRAFPKLPEKMYFLYVELGEHLAMATQYDLNTEENQPIMASTSEELARLYEIARTIWQREGGFLGKPVRLHIVEARLHPFWTFDGGIFRSDR